MNVFSIGYLSQMFQRPPSEVEEALDTIGAKPSLTLNGVRHFEFLWISQLRAHWTSGEPDIRHSEPPPYRVR